MPKKSTFGAFRTPTKMAMYPKVATNGMWDSLVKGPSGAFGLVVAADRLRVVAMFMEARAAGEAVRAARERDDWPPVNSELIAYHAEHKKELANSTQSGETTKGAQRVSREILAAAGAAASKLTPEELEAYVDWVVGTARTVAEAAKELGSKDPISDAESAALAEIEALLRGTAPRPASSSPRTTRRPHRALAGRRSRRGRRPVRLRGDPGVGREVKLVPAGARSP